MFVLDPCNFGDSRHFSQGKISFTETDFVKYARY